jgi:hypothetical protein
MILHNPLYESVDAHLFTPPLRDSCDYNASQMITITVECGRFSAGLEALLRIRMQHLEAQLGGNEILFMCA